MCCAVLCCAGTPENRMRHHSLWHYRCTKSLTFSSQDKANTAALKQSSPKPLLFLVTMRIKHIAVQASSRKAHLSAARWAKSETLAIQSPSGLEESPGVHSCMSSAVVASGLLFSSTCKPCCQTEYQSMQAVQCSRNIHNVEGRYTGHQQQLATAEQLEATMGEGRRDFLRDSFAEVADEAADWLPYSKSTSAAEAKSKNKVNGQAETATTV